MRARWTAVLGLTPLLLSLSCISVKAPERIDLGGGRPEPVDPARMPATSTHAECRGELEKAYQNIQWLEQDNERLQAKADEYKRERDQCRARLDRYEDD